MLVPTELTRPRAARKSNTQEVHVAVGVLEQVIPVLLVCVREVLRAFVLLLHRFLARNTPLEIYVYWEKYT
jgi:hypothetical protein